MGREIGSEFQTFPLESGRGFELPRTGSLVFSGRTAIEDVLASIPDATSVLLPSYCCDSMIDPFKRVGIDIGYYDVNYQNGLSISIDCSSDVLLWCNYFGFRNDMPSFGGIIIEDITHSFLSTEQFHERSDYLVASLRKWEPILCGGYASVKVDRKEPPVSFLQKKREAMNLKSQYLLSPDNATKEMYLRLFEESNQWLADNYSGLSIDSYSLDFLQHVDVGEQRTIRRNNAAILYEGLNGKVQFMFREEDMDCPLFVPIILPENRDYIRQHLVDNEIYCPVHWPHPIAECESNIYDVELSLICDQRYDENDMKRIVSVISEVL